MTTAALVFGWICGSLVQEIGGSVLVTWSLAALCGLAFGVGQTIWERNA